MDLTVFEAIKNRRSIRSFIKKDVSNQKIRQLIEAASLSPSAGNVQPWFFVVIRKNELKSELRDAAGKQNFLLEAPVLIVVCADVYRSAVVYGKRGENLYCIQDTAAATENILLATYALGLGACWVGAFIEEKVIQILHIPKGIRPMAIIALGYPHDGFFSRSRKPLDDIIRYETF